MTPSPKPVTPVKSSKDLPLHSFRTPQEWGAWLAAHQGRSEGIWLRIFKKGSKLSGLRYGEALDEALCHGWIDGQVKSYDQDSWIQRFTPRRPKSVWSRRNVGNVERLITAGRMTPAGMRQVEAAKADGRWAQAYPSPAAMELPGDFLDEVAKDPKAKAFLATLNRTNTYAIAWRLHTARKPATRARRLQQFLTMLSEGKKLY